MSMASALDRPTFRTNADFKMNICTPLPLEPATSTNCMPRISPFNLRRAKKIDSHLARLLPVCRDLRHAQNELRWLREHAQTIPNSTRSTSSRLRDYVTRRARGEPLQYILGTEHFGDLELHCRPGVLIPRQETAASVTRLAALLREGWRNDGAPKQLSVLDLCTGSGCIPLLLHHELSMKRTPDSNQDHGPSAPELRIVGVDISPEALSLAKFNARKYFSTPPTPLNSSTRPDASPDLSFIQADVLPTPTTTSQSTSPNLQEALQRSSHPSTFDILISNPPYISSTSFLRATSASVRKYEPILALVPPSTARTTSTPEDGDIFYEHLLQHADKVEAKVLLFEVADLDQAKRVAGLVVARGMWDGVEIWRDDPTPAQNGQSGVAKLHGQSVRVVGTGHGRSVIAWRCVGTQWLNSI